MSDNKKQSRRNQDMKDKLDHLFSLPREFRPLGRDPFRDSPEDTDQPRSPLT
jgi:hypothetical protein